MALDANLLRDIPLFSSLSEDELQLLVPLFNERTYQPGHEITKEGTPGFGFFVIESGSAKVTVHGEERRTLGPGAYFGEIALIDAGPRAATITTETPVVAHMLSGREFRPLVQECPALGWGLLQGLATILRDEEV